MSKQDWREFIQSLKRNSPEDVITIKEEMNPILEITALLNEYGRKGRHPVIIFEKIKGSPYSLVTGVGSTHERLAQALGVRHKDLWDEYRKRSKNLIPPTVIKKASFHANVETGKEIDIGKFPLRKYYPIDADRYITAGMFFAKDPVTGLTSFGYHRCQYKGKEKLGVSLHSRKWIWEFQNRAEKMGKNLEVAIVLGVHPIISLASMAMLPANQEKWGLAAGLFGEPMELAQCQHIDVKVPAWAELVIEGEILAGVREPEGPFGEFTGYSSHRSTEHVFRAKAVSYRDGVLYQSIGAFSRECQCINVLSREVDVLTAVSKTVPNVRAVAVPYSGAGVFHAYISIKKTFNGQPQQAMYAAFGIDHCLKHVVVVDEDIDVFNEPEVLWAMATRLQADRGVLVLPNSMCVILDPSTTTAGDTAKMGIDATQPLGDFADRLSLPEELNEKVRQYMK
jgi:2,5-furandicarboxylate decarboxylase 1